MPSRIAAFSAVLIALAGCADAPAERAESTGAAERTTEPRGNAPDEPAADVARVVCEKVDVHLKDPVVSTHRDGVHFLIENPGGDWGVDLHHESWAHGTSEGFEIRDEVTPDTSAMAPGSVTVACLPTGHSSYTDPGVPTATLTIVDLEGLYVPWDLACGFGEQFQMKIDGGGDEDAAEVFRRVPGVRPSDEFKTPKYPESPHFWPTVMVFRDGVPVARLMAPGTGSEWELLINSCPGSGITKT
jgi:hypothetical protein